ncbi:MAG: lipid A deacylase LpxR family protein [Porticoccaceae bacterium]
MKFSFAAAAASPLLRQLVLYTALAVSPASALAGDSKGTFTLALENDLFAAGSDSHYTHGTEIAYVSDTYMPGWMDSVLGVLPFHRDGDDARISWSLGQQMYTPADLDSTALIVDDRPYAGWTYTSLGVLSESQHDSKRHVDILELIVGIVGPDSGAEKTQRAIHKILDSDRPRGWDNQLGNEITADLRYQRKWAWPLIDNRIDVLPFGSFTLGSSQRRASAGFTFRVGSGLNADYGPPLIHPKEGSSSYFKASQVFYWYLFIGAQGEFVDYNIFLDGNRDGDSHSVDREEWIGNIQAGAVVGAGNWRISLTNLFLSREFKTQDEPDEYGSIAVSYRF